MSLSRSLSRLFSSSNSKKWPLLRSSSFCTKNQTPSLNKRSYRGNPKPSTSEFPKPSEIPYQAKVANFVHLVGSIGVPVLHQTVPSGVYAVAILVQESKKKDAPQLCIPVIFRGDLAQIAACYLKERDLVYITGQLTGATLPQTIEDKSQKTVDQRHIQVLANSLSFVQKTCPEKESDMMYDQDIIASDSSGGVNEVNEPNDDCERLWHDLVDNPQHWWDNRADKLQGSVNPKYPDFKQKITSKVLWLGAAPNWVLPKLNGLVFSDSKSTAKNEKAVVEENPSNLHLWSDLFNHPRDWQDNRSSKSKRAHAAFKHKKSGQKLWINELTPEWVLSKLDMLSFGQPSSGVNEVNEPNDDCERHWHDLVNNPHQWWDNRADKLQGSVNPKYPDFNQKSTSKGLWLRTAPKWVLPKLNGLVFCDSKRTTKIEKENLWRNLVENPNKWQDNRSSKLKPNHPDFKHKETGEALWLGSSTPPWVLPKLSPLSKKKDVGLEKATQQSDTLLS